MLKRTFRTTFICAVGAVVLATSCSNGIQQAASQAVVGAPEIDAENKPTTSKNSDQSLDNLTYTEAIQLAVVDIQEFWSAEMPTVYNQQYEPIPVSNMHPYDETNPPPQCGPEQLTYEDLRGNAFYCQFGDFIAWDDGELFPTLYKEFGPFAVAMVLSHEWGHAIQDQIGLTSKPIATVVLEQQADCFAGAWTRRLADGKSENLALGKGSLDSALGGMLKFRDEPGMVAAEDPGAHGSGFDRLRAFREGYTDGAEACSTYPSTDLPVLEFPFDVREYETGGNLPLKEILDAVLVDLNEYFKFTYPGFDPLDDVATFSTADREFTCGDETVQTDSVETGAYYCAADDTVRFSTDVIREAHNNIGDFAVGMALALPWATKAQIQGGLSADDVETPDAIIQRLCLGGAWANSYVVDRQNGGTSYIPKREITISGGDLDEAILYIISYTSGEETQSGQSLGFDHTEAFQSGVLEGPDACDFSLG